MSQAQKDHKAAARHSGNVQVQQGENSPINAAPLQLKDGNWTPEAEQALQSRYSGNADNEKLGKMVEGKSAAAVRSKLVSLGVYEKNEPKAVGGASGSRKIESVRAIEKIAGVPDGSFESLEKARKDELETLASTLAKLAK